MSDDPSPHSSPKPSFAGGAPLALLTIAGVIIGGFQGQPTIGLLTGFGLGVIVALLIWWRGTR